MTVAPVRVVVVDDHPLVHQGLASIIATADDLLFEGSALNINDGLRLLAVQPDIVLVDLRLGDDSGLAFVEQGRNVAPDCRFVILTSGFDRGAIRAALDLGVSGYVLKEAAPADMLGAIRQVAQGRRYLDPDVMEAVLAAQQPPGAGPEPLTERQVDVLAALGRGLGTQQIAAVLHISESTVKKHISEILAKLGLADRTQAALFAVAHGLVQIEQIDFSGLN